jgi:hypothetical protein
MSTNLQTNVKVLSSQKISLIRWQNTTESFAVGLAERGSLGRTTDLGIPLDAGRFVQLSK